MVHTFRALNNYFVVDTESGSVFQTDELTHLLVLSQTDNNPVTENKLRQYSASEISGADFELRALTGASLLFCAAETGVPESGDGRQVVKALCLNVCHACNLRCDYCFADGGSYGGGRAVMSEETAAAAVDFLIEKSGNRRNLEIDFFGGEPLLNFGVVKATVAYARGLEKKHNKNFRFTITTNGIDLDKEKADFINKEFSNVVISIDGRKAVHNLIRKSPDGGDYYDMIVNNALGLIKDRDGDYFIRGTFTNKNLDFSADAAALSDLGFKYISLEPAVLPDTHPLAIREEHLPRLYEEYELLAENLLKAGEDAPDFFHFRTDLNGAPCRDKLLKGCGAGGEYAAVAPDGGVFPCHQFDGKREYLTGVLSASGYSGIKPEKTVPKYPLLSRKECAECWAKYYCGGGCAAGSANFSGGGAPYGTACKLFKKRTELGIALYALRNGEENSEEVSPSRKNA